MYDDAYKPGGGPIVPPDDQRRAAEKRLAVREALSLAAECSGGVGALVKWIRRSPENQRIFWSEIYPRLLSVRVDGELEMGKRLTGLAATWLSPR